MRLGEFLGGSMGYVANGKRKQKVGIYANLGDGKKIRIRKKTKQNKYGGS